MLLRDERSCQAHCLDGVVVDLFRPRAAIEAEILTLYLIPGEA
jgi:hypothetical protein